MDLFCGSDLDWTCGKSQRRGGEGWGFSVSELKGSCWSDDITVFLRVVEVGKLIRKSHRGGLFSFTYERHCAPTGVS